MTTPLQEQLQLRAIDADALSVVGIENRRVGELLDGADPTVNEVRKIAAHFNIPIRSIISEVVKSKRGEFKLRENFRSKTATSYEVLDLLDRAEILAEILPENAERRAFIAIKTEEKNFEAAEELAAFFRAEVLEADPLSPLIDLEDQLCAKTNARTLVVGLRSIEGSVVAQLEHSFIFLSTRPDPRMRFTLAHEICHYLCDISEGTGSAWFDEDTLNPVGSFRRDEIFANTFASALLLPPSGVGEALNAFRKHHNLMDRDISDVEIIFLARFFGVSFQVAARRLEDLKLVPPGAGQGIYEVINKKFRSPEKFADELGLPARITYDWTKSNERIAREAHDAIADGRLSIGRLAELVELPLDKTIRLVAQ